MVNFCSCNVALLFFFFFFQAEDGIRDYKVTGVQTCALPIFTGGMASKLPVPNAAKATYSIDGSHLVYQPLGDAFIQWKRYRGGQASRQIGRAAWRGRGEISVVAGSFKKKKKKNNRIDKHKNT